MKDFVLSFRKFVRFFTSIIASREFAMVYCVIGTLTQVTHTYYLAATVSSYTGLFQIFQALLLSVFISASLLYFVSIADSNAPEEERKRVNRAILLFTIMEMGINLYYYTRHLIIDAPEMRIFDFLFGAAISMLIPYTIKLYSNTIKAKEWFDAEFAETAEQPEKLHLASKSFVPIEYGGDLSDHFSDNSLVDKRYVDSMVDTILDEFKAKVMSEITGMVSIQQETPTSDPIDEFRIEMQNRLVAFEHELKTNLQDMLTQIPGSTDIDIKAIEENILQTVRDTYAKDIDAQYAKKQELFLVQFDNKCRQIMNNITK